MERLRHRSGLGTIVCMLGVLVLASIGCRTVADEAAPQTPAKEEFTMPKPPTQTEQAVEAANSKFGFALLSKLLAEQKQQNVFISPSSVAMCLDMALAGAKGTTRQAMMNALALQGISDADINQANLYLRQALARPDPEVRLDIANSLWLGKGTEFVPAFLDIGTKFFGAKVSPIDFSGADAGRTINDWVKANTGGKIPEIVQNGPLPGMVCMLVNAVYFAARWTRVFDKHDTKPGPFTFGDGSTGNVPMMSQMGHYDYLQTAAFQAIRLPYGRGRVGMYIFLPAKSSSLGEFCKSLTSTNWGQWMNDFDRKLGNIALPKFKAEYGVKLNDTLKAMGMDVAFKRGQADFSGMCGKPGDVWIGQVLHKTYVEVDEEGTKAAGATSIGMIGAAVPRPEEPFQMVVNRPFFCAIVDGATNTILFMGAIVSPGAIGG